MNLFVLNSINIGVTRFSDIDGDLLRTILMIAIPILVIQLILIIVALVSLVKKEVPRADKVLWGVIIVVLMNMGIGAIIYFAIGSNHLDQKAAALENSEEGNNS